MSDMPPAADNGWPNTAVIYLARGADEGASGSFRRFLDSYSRFAAGAEHHLVVVLKGFADQTELEDAKRLFDPLAPTFLEVSDEGYDIGAYMKAADRIECEFLCFLNTHSELLADNWLQVLAYHLRRPEVGMAGATGSFESLESPGFVGPLFPNPHLRSNAFIVKRKLFLVALDGIVLRDKLDAYKVESGFDNLTRKIVGRGYDVPVIGRNGRAYPPRWWPSSGTYRQGAQENLIVSDNQTRGFDAADKQEKLRLMSYAWGNYVDPSEFMF
jgi:hypothetical protein